MPLVTALVLFSAGCGSQGAGAAGSLSTPAGPSAATGDARSGEERPEADLYLEVRLLETGGEGPATPWAVDPSHLEVPRGKVVAIRVVSPPGNRTGHSLWIGPPYNLRSRPVAGGGSTWLVFTADRPAQGIPLECGITGHPQLGMAGTLSVIEP